MIIIVPIETFFQISISVIKKRLFSVTLDQSKCVIFSHGQRQWRGRIQLCDTAPDTMTIFEIPTQFNTQLISIQVQ